MRELHVLRHAKAVPQGTVTDRERGLTGRGRRDADAVGRLVAALDPQPELVLCSPAARTRQTLDRLAASFRHLPAICFEEALYSAGAGELVAALRLVPPETLSVLLVGHNPGLHELALWLADGAGPLAARLGGSFPTATLASFRIAAPWRDLGRGGGRLFGLVSPRE